VGVEGLKVFRIAYELSLEVHRASLSWPKVEQYGGIADQIRRSSKSVCALIVEGRAGCAGHAKSSSAIF
jgi:four helix bundle protein